jgi:hypothetical protein
VAAALLGSIDVAWEAVADGPWDAPELVLTTDGWTAPVADERLTR